MLVTICYDVVDDNRRSRLARYLDGVADRVQQSVFEGRLDDRTLERVVRRAGRLIDPTCDSVRIYRLCETCTRQTIVVGRGGVTPRQEVIVL